MEHLKKTPPNIKYQDLESPLRIPFQNVFSRRHRSAAGHDGPAQRRARQEVIVKLFTAHCITEAPRLMILDSQGTTVLENARGGRALEDGFVTHRFC